MSDRLDPTELRMIVERAATGDQDAWRMLVDAYTARVYGLIRAQCGNPDLAEEITQSTFCTIAQKLEGYSETGRFESWLFHIAMNRLRDEMRRRKRQAVSVEEETLAGLAGSDAHEEAGPRVGGGLPAEDAEQLQAALAQLSEADQRIIHLRHIAGLSFKQIAALQDEPLGTVLARQHRALKKLRDILTADPGDDEAAASPGRSAREKLQ